jgi:hypothetical protein
MENRRTPDSAGLSNDLGKVAESSPRRPTSVPSDENHATLFGNWFHWVQFSAKNITLPPVFQV